MDMIEELIADPFPTCPCGCDDPYKGRTPSEYQQRIRHWLANGDGSAIIVATAGSGKTTTLEMLAYDLPRDSRAVFLAFGKAIATELSERLPFPASTFHSLCNRAVSRFIQQRTRAYPKLDKNKTDALIDCRYGQAIDPIRPAIVRLVSLCKGENARPSINDEAIVSLIDRHDIDWDSPDFTHIDVCDIVRTILDDSVSNLVTIDFDDMLWLVEVFGLKLDRHEYVMVDEAQDTNPVQRAIIRRLLAPDGRLIAVGDHAQAIYGFRGASNDALAVIAQEFGCIELPLTVSYRCARSIVELASQYGTIESHPSAPSGQVTYADAFKLTQFVPGQMVLCRNTAPLVQLAYRLIARRIPAAIKGRDIGAGLTSLIGKLAGKRTTLDALPDKIEAWRDAEVAKAMQKRQETKAQSIADKADSILALIDSLTPADRSLGISGLIRVIEVMFTDTNDHNRVLLSTIHKSKGLERDSVVILDWVLCPSKYAKQPWQQQQETNLQFVAITRAKTSLTFVESMKLAD